MGLPRSSSQTAIPLDVSQALLSPSDHAVNEHQFSLHLERDMRSPTVSVSLPQKLFRSDLLTGRCSRDQYVLTSLLRSGNPIPPLCPSGSFCPDDASGCLPLVELGGRCQLNRDGEHTSELYRERTLTDFCDCYVDECSPPPDHFKRPSPLDGTDTGAICLLGACT